MKKQPEKIKKVKDFSPFTQKQLINLHGVSMDIAKSIEKLNETELQALTFGINGIFAINKLPFHVTVKTPKPEVKKLPEPYESELQEMIKFFMYWRHKALLIDGVKKSFDITVASECGLIVLLKEGNIKKAKIKYKVLQQLTKNLK